MAVRRRRLALGGRQSTAQYGVEWDPLPGRRPEVGEQHPSVHKGQTSQQFFCYGTGPWRDLGSAAGRCGDSYGFVYDISVVYVLLPMLVRESLLTALCSWDHDWS
jgi:hypothetical protein